MPSYNQRCVFLACEPQPGRGLTLLTHDRLIKTKGRGASLRTSREILLQLFADSLGISLLSEGRAFHSAFWGARQKENTVVHLTHTSRVVVTVCVWVCVCSGRCLVMSQHSFSRSGLLADSYIKHTRTRVLVWRS